MRPSNLLVNTLRLMSMICLAIALNQCSQKDFDILGRASNDDQKSETPPPRSQPKPDMISSEGAMIRPLYGPNTEKQGEIAFIQNDVAYTYFGSRVRARHAREDGEAFRLYRSFPAFYFEKRTFEVEIIDKTAAGIPEVTVNITTIHPMDGDTPARPTGRFFFSGLSSVADYYYGILFDDVTAEYNDDKFHYRHTMTAVSTAGTPIKLEPGQDMEFEFTFNLRRVDGVGGVEDPTTMRGDANYYSRTWLLTLGKPGLVTWDATGGLPEPTSLAETSAPLAEKALAGGILTISPDLSAEPQRMLSQMAYQIAPSHAQTFVEGRRIFHTSFTDGLHSDPRNREFTDMVGLAGPYLNRESCISCHINNGRSLAPNEGEAIHDLIVKVGAIDDGQVTDHPSFGGQLQTQGLTGNGEGTVTISYETIAGEFLDGTPFELRKPTVNIDSKEPVEHFSIRTAPPLIGLGLLEAIDESDILAYEDVDDRDNNGISGRASVVKDLVNGEPRLGRFGWKAGRASLRQQAALALKEDMNVSSTILPESDGRYEIDDGVLDRLETYLSTLGVPPRRDTASPSVQGGEALFQMIGCADCHRPQIKTGENHPFAELRQQNIQLYSDLLLHDMGENLSSSLPGESAAASEWRTPPLWGIGLTEATTGGMASYLHDGRARTLMEAILWHGGEAGKAKAAVLGLSKAERDQLVAFLKSL
ncbi:di-heme oxidoredictase family protein [Pseudobacteriovorax antillogorgiicola]|uniref:CxxC motif-containing protein, DUF1111 family n=1 Tax=Pseudobacteriovorax antillogorgiicola TaxID=1513793 RepID=A0A1Y6BAF7_9BACT|nr:di-heme oxidoredictase family protein [Pseudobacteriovorax antillogorgiicola]TCS57421.1 CxxC motif-containing protein (DUF1111 family) [Pseudobacteriovorax antillogorgiicola]SMF01303.1 CxxC motif-containing protein, DUF1111 family [Pseudobacteriovorax antillogorgiicola]